MEYLKIVLTSFFSVAALFVLTKLMGNRQIAQMRFFDYIVGITIGSIAAEMATSLEKNPLIPLVAMTVYAAVSILLSYVSLLSPSVRKLIDGVPVELFKNGVFLKKNMQKAKLDIHALLTLCRGGGYFDLNEVESIIYENTGEISILPKAAYRPATVSDLNMTAEKSRIQYNVIVDGTLLSGNLKFAGKTPEWLKNELKAKNAGDIKKIMLATVDESGKISIYRSDTASGGRLAF